MSSRRSAYLTAFGSYFQLGSAVLAGLLSVRLALHYLDTDRVGLWTITVQSIGYFLLVDFGLTNATGRVMGPLVLRNDERELSRWFSLMLLVLCAQGLLAALAGWGLVDWVLHFFQLPPALHGEARQLWLFMLTLNAALFPTRILGGLLFAQNRAYWSSLGGALSQWVGLGLFWWLLHRGAGSLAYAWSAVGSLGLLSAGSLLGVLRAPLRLRFSWRAIQWADLRPLFAESAYFFLMAIAIQVIFLSQEIIITRTLGLAVVAAFSISAKAGLMGMQVAWRGFDASAPRWQQSYVAGDFAHLRGSFTKHFTLMMGAICSGALLLVAANRTLVALWTHRPELWLGRGFDFLLGAWLIQLTLSHGLAALIPQTPRVRELAFTSLLDAGLTIAFGLLLAPHLGLTGILIASLAAGMVSVVHRAWEAPRVLHLSARAWYGALPRSVLALAAVWLLGGLGAVWFLPAQPSAAVWLGEGALALLALGSFALLQGREALSLVRPLTQKLRRNASPA